MTGTTPPGPTGEWDPWKPPATEAVPPLQPSAADEPVAEAFDPYRFGAPSPNPFGYPSSLPGQAPAPGYGPPPGYPPPGYPPPGYPPPGYPPPGYPPPGYGPPHAYPPPPMYSQYPIPGSGPGDGRSIASLVLGIVSLLAFWLTVFDLPLIVLAIVFGTLGLGDAQRGAGNRGMAVAGIVCALIGFVGATILFCWILATGNY